MRATAIAQPNIALIKYWGKRDTGQNLPAVGSLSVTLRELYTEMQVELVDGRSDDLLIVNGDEDPAMLPRIAACLDRVLGRDRSAATVTSRSNFPIAAGLASSASAFAAVTLAAAAAAGKRMAVDELASLAGRASGSAARSLYGGFVELENAGAGIRVKSLLSADAWPLTVVVAITEAGPKAVGSTEAMEISRQTSPFYSSWIAQQEQDLATARDAVIGRDFSQLASVAEHNCLKMHSIMWSSRPPVVYWNASTMRCLQAVRTLQRDGTAVFFTIDAGPQVKAICLPEHAGKVRQTLDEIDGVSATMVTGLGDAARVMDAP